MTEELTDKVQRLRAIDWMRGLVMILMALDHVRFFFTHYGFAPEDMRHTWMALFLTRWVTHFCAPMFFLLAGTSAYLSGVSRGTQSLPRHLVIRGVWLIVLELTVIGFAWSFIPGDSFAGVIWCLGWSMIVLAAFVRLPMAVTATVALATIALHDLLDNVQDGALWHFLHVAGPVGHYYVLFPIIPWFAVMLLGYAIGPHITQPRFLYTAGVAATLLFVVLRLTNAYGNPAPFRTYGSAGMTAIAFLNTEKYPPSLQFLLMTIGPSLIVLAALHGRDLKGPIVTFGRVPFFFYVLHLYVIHLAALGGRSYSLPIVWVIWILIVVILYFPCRWFELLKARRRDWWLRYV